MNSPLSPAEIKILVGDVIEIVIYFGVLDILAFRLIDKYEERTINKRQ